jgi:methanogenic corrinoid protein MtbC1
MMIEPEAIDAFEKALLSLDRVTAQNLLLQTANGYSSIERVENLIAPALERIGEGWERGQVALSQVYMSGRICEDLVDAMLPPGAPERKGQPRMALAVLEDYHLLGKRVVYAVLRAAGFELLDYGRVNAEQLVQQVHTDGVEVLLISALMLPSALRVKDVRAGIERLGRDVKIVVGGAPFRFDAQLWREVSADAMGRTASDALQIIHNLGGRQ